MKAFGIVLGAIGTIFVIFVNWILGFATIVLAIILLLVAKKPENFKKCPKCAEGIKAEAIVCRFCGYEFPQPTPEELISKKEALERKISLEIDYIKMLQLKEELKKIEKEIGFESK
jgi:hypothetical protein